MLTITSFGDGKCVWCMATGEGVQATFKDGLNGFLCKRHLWEALKARSAPAVELKEQGAGENQTTRKPA